MCSKPKKNKRNVDFTTFLSLKIMPQTGIEPSVKSAKPEKQEGSAHLLLSVSKSVLSTTPDDLKNKDLNSYGVPMNVHLPLYISRKPESYWGRH